MPGSVNDLGSYLLIAWAMGITAAAAADEAALPPLGFFEYLGAMVEHEGELLDPLSLEAAMDDEVSADDDPATQPPVAQEGALGGNAAVNQAEEVQ